MKHGNLRFGFTDLPLAVCQSQSSKSGSDGCVNSPLAGEFNLRGMFVLLRLFRQGHPRIAHCFNGGVDVGLGERVPSGTTEESCFLTGLRVPTNSRGPCRAHAWQIETVSSALSNLCFRVAGIGGRQPETPGLPSLRSVQPRPLDPISWLGQSTRQISAVPAGTFFTADNLTHR